MISRFQALNFSMKLMVLAGIPALLVLGLSLWVLVHLQSDVRASERLRNEIELALSLGNLAHQHAVERGLSVGFISSQGAQGSARLQTQRQQSDEVTRQFLQDWNRLKSADTDSLQQQAQQLVTLLDQKAKIRQAVDNLIQPNPAFAYYSDLNIATLDLVDTLALDVTDPGIAAQFASYRYFLWTLEKAGLLRGKLNGVIGKGEMLPYDHAELREFIRAQDNFLTKAIRHASAGVRVAIQTLQRSEAYQTVQTVSRVLSQPDASLEQIEPAHRENWFALATQNIDALKQSSDVTAQALQEQLALNQSEDRKSVV